jgi:hypothetical protein
VEPGPRPAPLDTVVVEDSALPIYLRGFLLVALPGLLLVLLSVWASPSGSLSTSWKATYVVVVLLAGVAGAYGVSGVRNRVTLDPVGVRFEHTGRPRVDEMPWSSLRMPEPSRILGQVSFQVEGRSIPVWVTPGVARAVLSSPWAPRWERTTPVRQTLGRPRDPGGPR